jgi:Domain of unknown function (DUF4397)
MNLTTGLALGGTTPLQPPAAEQAPRVVRLVRALAVLALSLGLLGYGGPAAFAAVSAAASPASAAASPASAARAPASRGAGYLRLAHLSPNTPAVDVYLYPFGQASAIVVLRHVAYGTVSPYRSVASGEYTVAMRLAGTGPATKPVLSTTVDVTAGHAYTVAGMGPKSGLRLQVIDDQLSCPPGRAMVRVIQASLREHLVTVTADGRVLSRRQAFATVTSYRAMRPGTWSLRAAGPGERAASQVTLAPGSIQTLIVLDDPGHLAITVLGDAAGSEVTPVGGAATGFGGTAARPGRSPVPWLTLAAAGVVLILAGLVRFRRVRWARRAVARIR